jgi:hypothetical protein
MGYCGIVSLRTLLPKVMTIGDNNITTPTIQRPGNQATITVKEAQRFIEFAAEFIDSRLSTIYVVPLKRIKIHETSALSNVTKGSKMVYVRDNGPFNVGWYLRLSDNSGSALFEIEKVSDDIHGVELSTAVDRNFAVPLVSIVEYPDPISLMCAKLAVSMVIDRQFVAEQNPDVSGYGKSLRTQVSNDIDSIMAGTVRLNGQDQVGRRFCRTTLRDTWSTSGEIQAGQGKET